MFWNKKKCCADAGKSECSLIEELRELQEEVNPGKYKYPGLKVNYFSGGCMIGAVIKYESEEEERIKLLEEALENEKYNIEINKKLEEKKARIKQIKKELGIT